MRLSWMGLSAAITLCALGVLPAQVEGQSGTWGAGKPSMGQSISQGFKSGAAKVGGMFRSKTPATPTNDPVALSSKSTPSPRLFVALARLHEEEGRLSAAVDRYEKALAMDPNYPGALLGMAQIQERLGHPLEAVKLYERAAKTNPEDASVANNRGLFYAKRKQYVQSTAALEQAVQLKPQNAKYRHNLALVLVQMGRNDEAFRQLRAVHAEPIAHYNLGYLLKTKGDDRMAAFHFARAAAADPSLAPAKYWVAELNEASLQAQRPPVPVQGSAVPPAQPVPVQRPVAQPAATVPLPASNVVLPPYVADRSRGPAPRVHVIPPPPRRSAPVPSGSAPALSGPQLGYGPAPLPPAMSGLQAPMPGVGHAPRLPAMPPLPPDSRRPPPVRRLPTVD